MSHDGGASRTHVRLAWSVCLTLFLAGLALTALAGPAPLDVGLPELLLPVVLVPAYVFAQRVALHFEVGGNAHSVTLAQLPLALGVLLVPPWMHLGACLTAAVLMALVRRQHPQKAGYNIGVSCFEVGVTAFTVSMFAGDGGGLSLGLWLGLLTGLLVADVVGSLGLAAVWALLGIPVSAVQLVHAPALQAATAAAATGVTVVAVSAASVEPASLLIVLALAAVLTWALQQHRQLRTRQESTQELYDFVRDLGPVDADQDGLLDVLHQVRLLLRAERLELVVHGRAGAWHQLICSEGLATQRLAGTSPARRTSSTRSSGQQDTMTTTLLGSVGLLGVLTAHHRLGDVRTFDLGDVRTLETVGAELATALERGQLLADLQRTATTDALTGLPNLAETTRLLDELLARNGGHVVVATAAVESFHEVSTTLGSAVGDDLLLEAVRRFRAAHPDALIGRTGGARFTVAVPAEGIDDIAMLFGLGLRALVEGEARIGTVGTHIRLAVGVTQAPVHGDDGQTLLRRAGTALSAARTSQGGPVAWAPAYEVQGQRRLAVVTALREAVATGAIGLAFQPKIDARTGAARGVEALARWTHPALGAVAPDEFIPLAEASGFIGLLTTTVLRQAATAARGWQRRAAGVGVSVNVSADTVLDPTFITEVAAVLGEVGLDPGLLTLELTEGVVVSDPAVAVERLGELRAYGVRVSVDDFGTGYSSLTYLKGLPVDEVKIDKTFIAGVGSVPADEAVVRAVVDIAHTLGLTVVAEGVETPEQASALALAGVDELQGFLHARPMPALAIGTWLRAHQVAQSR
ncbi:MAG TPA: bifunctional diguanylate cyclase/phosphodiesterase [Mycobacteriales bacterium]|nr:bifunctional diguanylate cyclase/phosphodiesterase [Mycobacteriales bacterium]